MKFEELELNNNVLDALYDMRFDTCTPVQEKCIPEILKGRDVLGVAQTGTGKTAAYLLPIMSKIDSGNYPEDAINCLIMSPTRELAQQIDQAMQGFGYYLQGVSSVAVYGGNDGNRYDQELKSLRMGADVVIATPGRFISHMSLGNVDLSKVSFFVLDEADRMLDMGFSEDIMTIAKGLPKTCQTIMFSATMPDKINELARTLLKNPVEVKLAVSKPAEKIKQTAYVCHETQKLGIIKNIFKQGDLKRVIIFCGAKQKVKQVSQALQRMKINCSEMHSDLDQAQRDEVMFQFKSGQIDVLVATDILSRGIDIDDIAMVINYDVPHDAEDYVHRIGRTARADRDGAAITLVSKDDIYYFQQIEKFLEKEVEKVELPDDLGEAPAYAADGKPQRRRSSAKSIRRKDRDQTAHKRKPRRTKNEQRPKEVDAKSEQTNEKKAQERSKTADKQPAKNRQKSNKRNNSRRTEQNNTDGAGAQRNKQRRNKRQASDNKTADKQVQTQANQKNKRRRKPNNNRNTQREDPHNGRRKFEPAKTETKPESGISAIIKKPLKWLKSLGKK
ncbi:MAG: DEAD/DEAH box helicase [Prevotella sp.]|nr:DEAD/DEAH box helicase [Prevotellaceae bacterium]MDY3103722.1 DEAD/DEAH box helicase [Prevotella sp.]MDY5843714.1 DEAD/DEAH box helicase [Prevotella sp.]